MSREKKSEKKATVERRVQKSSMVVKMNQPWRCSEYIHPNEVLGEKRTDHQEKAKFVGESVGAGSHELLFDGKAAGCEDDGK